MTASLYRAFHKQASFAKLYPLPWDKSDPAVQVQQFLIEGSKHCALIAVLCANLLVAYFKLSRSKQHSFARM